MGKDWIVQVSMEDQFYTEWLNYLKELGVPVFGRDGKIREINTDLLRAAITKIMATPIDQVKDALKDYNIKEKV